MPNAFKHDFSDHISPGQPAGSNRRRKKRGRGRFKRLSMPRIPKFSLSLKVPKLPSQSRIPTGASLPRIPAPGWFPLIGTAIGFVAIMLFVSGGGRDVDASVSLPQEEWISPQMDQKAGEATRTTSTKVKAGDNAISALVNLGFDHSTSHALISKANATYKLRNIRIGHSFTRIDSSNGTSIFYNIDGKTAAPSETERDR